MSRQVPWPSWSGFKNDLLMTLIPFLNVHLSNILTIFIKTSKLLDKERKKVISVLVYRKPSHTDQYLTTVHTPKQTATKVLFPHCLIERIPLSPIKMT